MIFLSRNLLFIAAAAAIVAAPAFAETVVSHTKMKDESARAEYTWIEGGCVTKHLEVWGSNTRVKDDNTPDTQSVSYVNFSIYNYCDRSNTFQIFYHGMTTNAVVTIDSNLRSASITSNAFTVNEIFADNMGNVTPGRTFNLVVDMHWSSNDPIDKISGTLVTTFPGYHRVSQLTGHYRYAVAGGVIADGGQNWVPAAPDDSFMQLYKLTSGETTLIKD